MTAGDPTSIGDAFFCRRMRGDRRVQSLGTFGSCRLSPWRNFPKAISHTIERIDHVEGIVDRHELLTHSFDVSINCTFVDVNVIGICRFQ